MTLPIVHPYTQAEYDAFGWNQLSRSMIDPAESYGLDYESARDATPRWFAVSFGNGNDGVSHTFPDYYVRCSPDSAYHLAAVAMLANFNNATPEDKGRIIAATEIDGESDYTISATIYNPEDIEPETTTPDIECDECGQANNPGDTECVRCEADLPEPEDNGTWCGANGCWIQCDVFAVENDAFNPEPFSTDGNRGYVDRGLSWLAGKPAYASMADAFEQTDLDLTAD